VTFGFHVSSKPRFSWQWRLTTFKSPRLPQEGSTIQHQSTHLHKTRCLRHACTSTTYIVRVGFQPSMMGKNTRTAGCWMYETWNTECSCLTTATATATATATTTATTPPPPTTTPPPPSAHRIKGTGIMISHWYSWFQQTGEESWIIWIHLNDPSTLQCLASDWQPPFAPARVWNKIRVCRIFPWFVHGISPWVRVQLPDFYPTKQLWTIIGCCFFYQRGILLK